MAIYLGSSEKLKINFDNGIYNLHLLLSTQEDVQDKTPVLGVAKLGSAVLWSNKRLGAVELGATKLN